jgi:hypothetical protein
MIATLPVGGPTTYEPVTARDYVGAKMTSINIA